MQGLMTLFVVVSILLTGCSSDTHKTTIGFKDSPKSLTVAIQTVEVTPIKEAEVATEKATPKADATPSESIAEATPIPETPLLAPRKKMSTAIKEVVIEQPAILITEPVNAPTPVISNWKPNEVHLIRGAELINGLQRDLARKPNVAEMQQRLQSHMGLSESQAQQVISHLKLE